MGNSSSHEQSNRREKQSVTRVKLDNVTRAKDAHNGSKVVNSAESWMSTLITEKFGTYREINRNFKSKITHAGFIHYLHLCWIMEAGCEIRPDMIYYTVISELASLIIGDRKQYAHLLTNSCEKEYIFAINRDNTVEHDCLARAVGRTIKDTDLLRAICNVNFDSDVTHADYARKMSLIHTPNPSHELFSIKSGIPHIDIIGAEKDWVLLYNTLVKINNIIPTKYLLSVLDIVMNIIFYTFGTKIDESFTEVFNSSKSFFEKFFEYGPGQTGNSIHGWAKSLYINGLSDDISLAKFPSHISCIPFVNIDNARYYCQIVTLAFSKLDKSQNTLRPGYGIIMYELDETAYSHLINPKS